MRAWPSVLTSVLGAVLLTVLVLAATLIGARVDTSCPPPFVRSADAVFARCVGDDGAFAPKHAKVAARSFEERWRMAAGPLGE
jgi:hypothetical protein